MRRRLAAPAFVLTIVAAEGCSERHVLRGRRHLPPRGPLTDLPHEVVGARQNPRDSNGRVIYANGRRCAVHVARDDWPGDDSSSWQPPKLKRVDCPEEMDDPAWDWCPESLHLRTDGKGCACVVDGNPPGPPYATPCPTGTDE